jgi:putative transcriptional regulator
MIIDISLIHHLSLRPPCIRQCILEKFILTNENIPALVKDLRKDLGLTQEQLARELGVAFCTVNQWENGRRVPQPFLLKQLLVLKASLGKNSTPKLTEAQSLAIPKSLQPVVEGKKDKEPALMTVAEKFRQLAKLMVSAQSLSGTEGQPPEEECMERWMKLRRMPHA